MSETRLDRAIEGVLSLGLLGSGGLLVAGLLLDREALLRLGVVLLMATPAARVVVLALAMLVKRDWLFAAISLWILGVLVSTAWVAIRL